MLFWQNDGNLENFAVKSEKLHGEKMYFLFPKVPDCNSISPHCCWNFNMIRIRMSVD